MRNGGALDHIVVVDDDEGLHKLMRHMLRVPNAEVVPARSGEEAERVLREGIPDLLLLDAMLPDVTGFELCRRLRERHTADQLPILIITALQDAASVDAAFAAGADDYITKPINWAVLRQRVARLLAAKRGRSELAAAERVMARLIEHAPDALLSLDPDGAILTANRAAHRLLLPPGETWGLLGRRLPDLLRSPGEEPRGALAEGEAEVRLADGSSRRLEVSAGKVSVGRSIRWMVILHDVTDRRRGEEELRLRALYDPLTGIPNRVLFLDRLGQELALAGRGGERPFAVAFIDLDDFKRVNDDLGHQAGDEYLVAVSRRLEGSVRPGDTVCRYGGDEFCVLLPGIGTPREARAVIERLREALAPPVLLEGRACLPSASFGLAFADGAGSARDLLEKADAAMYEAKRAGKGGCRIHGEEG